MKPVIIVSLLAVVAIAMGATATQQSARIEVPNLPTERDQFGGRPGVFHFVTNEQAMSDARDLKEAVEALDRIQAGMASLNAPARELMQGDLLRVRQFAMNVHAARTTNAGTTASQVESRLNESKGKFMCGACHGHGMMHGGGMQMRGGAQN